MTYQVLYGDSPAIIARKWGVPIRALIDSNPHKPTTIVAGVRTWRDLRPGEFLNVPGSFGVGDLASDAIDALTAAGGPCDQSNVAFVCAAQAALGVTRDGKWGSDTARAAQARSASAPGPCGHQSWWAAPGQSNCGSIAGGPAQAATMPVSNVSAIAALALAALVADPNYCVNVGRSGTAVNTAVHNFKAAWNAANPSATVPIGTGKYEPSVADALSSSLGGQSVPQGCGAAVATAPASIPAVAPAASGSNLSATAAAALAALNADPNYCSSVSRSGTSVNTAVHNFKAAWNSANPSTPVPIGTGKYEPSVAAALSSALGGQSVPSGCGAGAGAAPSVAPSSNLPAAAAAALAALNADPNYCSSVARPGTSVNTAVHNFKAAWNSANPGSRVPIGTGKYEPSVASALSSALGGQSVPSGCGAAPSSMPTPTPTPTGMPTIAPTPTSTQTTTSGGAPIQTVSVTPGGTQAVTPPTQAGISTGAIVAGAVGALALVGIVAAAATSGKTSTVTRYRTRKAPKRKSAKKRK